MMTLADFLTVCGLVSMGGKVMREIEADLGANATHVGGIDGVDEVGVEVVVERCSCE